MNTNQTEKIDGLSDAFESLRRAVQGSASSTSSQLDLHYLSAKLVELNDLASCLAKEQYILGSLRFKAMSARLSRIQEAYGTTFSWIFDSNCDAGFTDWLHNDRGIYWITGKPGSGKSTLMKYLYKEQRTRTALRAWAGSSKLVMAGFFFWSVGTPMQKSQEGLLRCLLFEILRQCPDLMETACPERWLSNDYSTDRAGWDLPELSEAIFRIFSHEHSSTKFCIFIDGLDEYDDRHLDVIRVLDVLASSTRFVKVCVSSRQWNVFEDAYGRDASRLLYLEDLTRGDIEDYVRSKLEEHTAITMFSLADEGYDSLIEDIVNKAEGVFLWVFLVVRSLCEGLTNGDGVYLLQERVRRLPANLERYFRLIIESVDVEYREIMAKTFQVTLNATEPLTLIAYSFLDEADPNYAINARIRAFDHNDIFVRHRQTKRRINGRYKGLLEVLAESSASDFFGYRVEFFHRTVHDFLRLKEIQNLLCGYLSTRRLAFNANESLCKVYLSLLKAMSWTRRDLTRPSMFQGLLHTFMYHTRQVEFELDASLLDVLDELEDAAIWLSSFHGNCQILWDTWTSGSHKTCDTFLEFAIRSGLRLYVAASLKNNPHLIRKCPRPLLNSVLRSSSALQYQDTEMPEMVTFLWQQGVYPNQWYRGSTVFGHYLHDICYTREGALRLSTVPSVIRRRQEILEILLAHQANVNENYLAENIVTNRSEGVALWGHFVMAMQELNAPRNVTKAYLDILKTFFRYGADPNLIFDPIRQETVWGSFLRAVFLADKRVSTESRVRLHYEMVRCFLLNLADPEILLDVPRIRYVSLSDVLSRVFSSQERRSLHEIISLEHRRQGKRRCCVVGSARWMNMLRNITDLIWLLATSVMTKWDNDTYAAADAPFVESTNDDDQPPLRTVAISNVVDVEQPQLLSCSIVLQSTEYSLQVPEMAVFCSHRTGQAPGKVSINITALYAGAILGTATFDHSSISLLNAEVIVWNHWGKGWTKRQPVDTPDKTGRMRPKEAATEALHELGDASEPGRRSRPGAMRDIHDESSSDTLSLQQERPRSTPKMASKAASQAPLNSTYCPQSHISLDATLLKAGQIVIKPRAGTRQLVTFNRPTQTGPPAGTSMVQWLINKLRSRKLSGLLDTLEMLLFALNEATQIALQISLPRESDVQAFTALTEAANDNPDAPS
jgi:hypothetical protein